MTFPIQHCLLYPERAPAGEATLDFTKNLDLNFHAPEALRYPCLELAYEALRNSTTAPAVFNAANEIAVARFLNGEITFLKIPQLIEKTLERFDKVAISNISDLLALNEAARQYALAHNA
jgi:1-deoxy-D-xylulose-5-phosphate reductoisomerase